MQKLALILALALLPAISNADVYRCKVGDKVLYQDTPCPGLQGAIKLNANAAPPHPADNLRAQIRSLKDQISVAEREAAQERQRQADQAQANADARNNAAHVADCRRRSVDVQRAELDAANHSRNNRSGRVDTWWANRAAAEREKFRLDCW